MAYRRRYLSYTLTGEVRDPILTDEELSREFNGGDFALSPWFEARELDRYFATRGFPKNRREIAVAALRRLYPPQVCLDLLRRPRHGGLVLPLFRQVIAPHIFTDFQLGLDLDAAQPWDDTDLLARLRNRNRFLEAWTELEAWANLRSAGIDYSREPRTLAGKRPDFALFFGHRRYILEVKSLDESDAEAFATEFHDELSHDVPSEMFRPGKDVTVSASSEYAALAESDLDRLDAEREVIRQALREAYQTLVAADLPTDVHPVEPYAAVTVEAARPDSRGNSVTVEFVPPASAERRAARAARLVARAFGQLPADGVGVVMLRAREGVDLREVATRVDDWVRDHPIASRNCKLVVVRTPAISGDRRVQAAAIVPIHGHRVTPEEAQVLRIAALPRHGQVPDPWGGDEPAFSE